jgi:hypothetical protein
MVKFQDLHYNIKPESILYIYANLPELYFISNLILLQMYSHPIFVKIAINGTYHKKPVASTVQVYCKLDIFIMNLYS